MSRHTGDDIAMVMSHAHGEANAEIHQFCWDAFVNATEIAKEYGLYGAGQDLLTDAPSGNVRGAGPAVAEIEMDHTLEAPRPAESFLRVRGRQMWTRRLQPADISRLRGSDVLLGLDVAADDRGLHVLGHRHEQRKGG